ncbi:sex peptide receptor-like [Octopus sinensis]|uniref:Sex peptide receptor-like n=1 Tax=Octopus sinensis TaxID=2607531 RepID=A0A6P7SED6_9MOLL|nr:sex peptide receptor-like [Octopus sinensis]XP_036359331.1 sex peptide receptor-like [Octopus sinensis]XP_036359332.1 sex peptide receptor-like [Octopus sinensis]XP_036359333.1 sex peptide receptor-like [Octopus sinensis]XP_036359334.1 sex peptide receptor-like [Octopus sinensis]XP_036359335.1 sex peptide receptor-like [Octopus sinensis]XP_036359336.1 sex peptide receptor-like [Octopus sinensis]
MSVTSDYLMKEEMTNTDSSTDWETTSPSILRNIYPFIIKRESIDEIAVPILGYIAPPVAVITIITNSLVVIVLMKRNMKSPTNCVLIGMALSDMFTGVIPMPLYLYFYAAGYYQDYVPNWCCRIYHVFTLHIPTIFHTASIWLTLTLAIQRYIYICHSFRARTWCTINNVIKGTVAIYFIAILFHLTRFFEYDFESVELMSLLHRNQTVIGCYILRSQWLVNWIDLYYNVYFWFRVIFVHLIPCTALVVLNGLLIHAMTLAKRRRKLLIKQNKRNESKKIKDTNCTTLMLVAVVFLFLLVEVPLGILMIITILQNTLKITIFADNVIFVTSSIINMMIMLSYPLNFFIYCAMSKQFRNTFKRMFCGGPLPIDRESSQYMTLPTENGKTIVTTDETKL